MNLSKVNIYLTLLLLIGLSSVFLLDIKNRQTVDFQSRRIDELEKRPTVFEAPSAVPVAGESGILVSDIDYVIDQRLAALNQTPVQIQSPKPTTAPTAAPSGKKTTYLPIYGGAMRTTQTSWTDVAGSDFQLNISNFGSSSYAVWDATAWVIGGSGNVNLRILDATHGVVVPGSEINGSSASQALITSGRLTFLSGNNNYRIQISSQTSSPVEFDFGRIKIEY